MITIFHSPQLMIQNAQHYWGVYFNKTRPTADKYQSVANIVC